MIIVVGDGPHGSFGKKALNHEIFIIGFLKFVERKHSALFSAGCLAQQWKGNCSGKSP
jgi:hypothetical protein